MVPGTRLGFMQGVSDRVRLPHADEGIKGDGTEDDGSPTKPKSLIHWLAWGSLG